MTDVPIDVTIRGAAQEAVTEARHHVDQGDSEAARSWFNAAEAAYDALSSLLVVEQLEARAEEEAGDTAD